MKLNACILRHACIFSWMRFRSDFYLLNRRSINNSSSYVHAWPVLYYMVVNCNYTVYAVSWRSATSYVSYDKISTFKLATYIAYIIYGYLLNSCGLYRWTSRKELRPQFYRPLVDNAHLSQLIIYGYMIIEAIKFTWSKNMRNNVKLLMGLSAWRLQTHWIASYIEHQECLCWLSNLSSLPLLLL